MYSSGCSRSGCEIEDSNIGLVHKIDLGTYAFRSKNQITLNIEDF